LQALQNKQKKKKNREIGKMERKPKRNENKPKYIQYLLILSVKMREKHKKNE